MSGARVLVVEDDPVIADGLAATLAREGYEVERARDGETALACAAAAPVQVMILDLGLPGLDGLAVLRAFRARDPRAPVLVLSARAMELDKVQALDAGADDYVTKPFSLSELLARLRALVRRAASPELSAGLLRFGEVEIDARRHVATRAGRPIVLTAREFRLLEYLFANRDLVLSREQILEAVWGHDCASGPRTVDVHMAKLRKKVEADPDAPRHLLTVRAAGYKLAV